VGWGRLLGLGSLVCSGLALAVLHRGPVHVGQLVGVVLFHLGALWLSFRLPWRRWPAYALLAFPVAALAALVMVVDAAPDAAGVFSGFFALCFAYTGLFLPQRSAWLLLGPAVAAYAGTVPSLGPEFAVRVAFLAGAWVVLAEVLGRLERRQAELVHRLQADNRTDPLTGLANRRGMELFLAEALPGDVLVVVDLDHFKRLNDERGHAAGDAVLRAFGRVLLQELRTRDRAARSGGEEMVVLLRCGESRCGEQVTARLRWTLAAACPGVTFSAGLAVVRDGQPVHDTLEAADRAMYRAKEAGRDQVWLAGDPARGVPDVPVVAGPAVPAPVAAGR
jgi:diguanylate cyclase (GGDEF)-like protein